MATSEGVSIASNLRNYSDVYSDALFDDHDGVATNSPLMGTPSYSKAFLR